MERRHRLWWPLVLLILSPLLMAHHPGYPAPIDLSFVDDADQGDGWVMTTTPGLVRASDPQALICKQAFGVSSNLYAAVLGDTHYALAAEEGLAITLDGCHLDAFHPLEGRPVDVASKGDDRVAIALSEVGGDTIHISLDGGLTLEDPIDVDEGLRLTGLGFSDDDHLVASAFDDDADPRGQAKLVVITDLEDGPQIDIQSYESGLRYPYLMDAGHQRVAVALRDNITPMAAWGPANDPDAHLQPLDTWPLHGHIDPDRRLRIGPLTPEWTGLWHADDQGALHSVAALEDHDTRCTYAVDDDLWVCSSGAAQAYELWRLSPWESADAPDPIHRLAYLQGPRQDCPPDSEVAQICPDHWSLVEATIPAWEPDDPDDSDEPDDPDEPGEPGEEANPNEPDPSFPPPPGSTPVEPPQDDPSTDEESSAGCAHLPSQRTEVTTLLALVLLLLLRHAADFVGRSREAPETEPDERWSHQ